jgi:hypothetical protein
LGGVVFNNEMLDQYFNSSGFPGLGGRVYAVAFKAMTNSVLEAQHRELS